MKKMEKFMQKGKNFTFIVAKCDHTRQGKAVILTNKKTVVSYKKR